MCIISRISELVSVVDYHCSGLCDCFSAVLQKELLVSPNYRKKAESMILRIVKWKIKNDLFVIVVCDHVRE